MYLIRFVLKLDDAKKDMEVQELREVDSEEHKFGQGETAFISISVSNTANVVTMLDG